MMNSNIDPPKGSDRERDNKFYAFLGGGAKLRLAIRITGALIIEI